MEDILITLLLAFATIFVVATVMIYQFLKERGEDVSFLLLRLNMIGYVNRYREITREETAHTGSLFYIWIVAINLALITFVVLLFVL